ncbi:MAG: NfeD family protein [Planctomycetota bacterium]|nr:NfeD family protein [Planctomycetota bacterium]
MTEQTLLLWAFGLLFVALSLIFLEVFVPSGGLIGLTAGVAAIAAVVVFFRVSTGWGAIGLLLAFVLCPMAINFALRVMPHTPMGKHLILSESVENIEQRAAEEQRLTEQQQALVGATGVALTPLRPVGTAEIEGTKLEVLAEGGAVERGQRLRVTSVEGNVVRVRGMA